MNVMHFEDIYGQNTFRQHINNIYLKVQFSMYIKIRVQWTYNVVCSNVIN